MPGYAFGCPNCGPFDLSRPMAEAGDPASCPTCGGEARRIFTPPGLALLQKPIRQALEAEEGSAHEPEVVTEKKGRPLPHTHARQPPWVTGH